MVNYLNGNFFSFSERFVYSEDTSKLIDLWNNRASPWVSVNYKRKPKGKVLLWVENYGVVAKCYYDEDWYHDLNGKTVCVVDYYGKPTHWMFEPESPILAT